jgi:Mg2+-importing ATPase
MLEICKWVELDGEIVILSEDIKNEVIKVAVELNKQGMRVLALAQKNEIEKNKQLTKEVEKDMVLIGYLSFLDPPKQSSKSAIEALNEYNVRVKVLTGDSEIIAKYICKFVGIKNYTDALLGSDIDNYTDKELKPLVDKIDIFAKLSPQQKMRIINILKSNGHVVGFMGDGINDAPAMKESDVAISVDSAVDIAKESADIILLRKDLNVLVSGVIEGRRIFCNIIKYIKMTISSNFGNMFSVLFASVFLPFLPMLPVQILVLNIFYDISQMSIPWDNVDQDYMKVQKKWDTKSILSFMLWVGPTSSICDIILFLVMYNIFDWNSESTIELFHSGWFVASMITQTIIIYLIRTSKKPFIQSNPSIYVFFSTTICMLLIILLPYLKVGNYIRLIGLPLIFFGYLSLVTLLYIILVQIIKIIYVRKYKYWL